jgi:hypothetical protein
MAYGPVRNGRSNAAGAGPCDDVAVIGPASSIAHIVNADPNRVRFMVVSL